jgi:hypothetical protein
MISDIAFHVVIYTILYSGGHGCIYIYIHMQTDLQSYAIAGIYNMIGLVYVYSKVI